MNAEQVPPPSHGSGTHGSARVPLHVIVAEDDAEGRNALVSAVRSLGHECRAAGDGLEAWEMHQRQRADVILSDWQMPRMDGLELCRRTCAARSGSAYTYFIFLTSYADKEHLVQGLEAGADDYHTKPVDLDELRVRLVSAGRVVALYRQLAEKNAVLRRDSQASFRVARVDALTHVANRLSMDEDLKVLWSRVQRYSHRYSIAIGDVDWFKIYNDHFGHLAGDDVLRRVAHTLREHLRAGDGLYRYGGEEFVVVLPDQSLAEGAHAMERVRVAVESQAVATPAALGVLTVSFGVAELDRAIDTSPEQWLARADAALYRAKARGRNCVECDPPGPRPGVSSG